MGTTEYRSSILVIDDEKVIRDGCKRILERENLFIETAENGEEGLELIRNESFDVVLLDLIMPGIGGIEVLQELRDTRPELIVIVITGYATVENAVEAMKKGAYDFIAKPFSPDQLRLVVHRALEKRSLIREAEILRIEREESLRDIAAEKSRIMTIVRCMANGVLVTDSKKNIVLNNPAVGRMLGIDAESMVEKPLSEVIPNQDLVEMIDQVMSHPDRDFTSVSRELEKGEFGETFLRAHSAPVRNEEGGLIGCVTVLEDISHLKELDQMKSDFVAMVSHELRSPLSAVYQQLSVIIDGLAGEVTEKQKKLLTRAKERNIGLLEMINNLLDLSKIEAGHVVQQKVPLHMEEVLSKTVELLGSTAEKKNIPLSLELSSEMPFVYADRENMEEVFTNLISNAIAYTPEGGKVSVRGGKRGEYLEIRVCDTGIGISQEDIPKIFDKFYRVKSEKTRQIVGSGLGLPIVKKIVEAHLGSIEVESELGKGSTFTVLLPKGIQ